MEKTCRVHSWKVVNDKGDAIESLWLDGLLDNLHHLNGFGPDTECRVMALYEGKVHEVVEQILSDFPHKPVTQANLSALEHEIRELRRELHETLQA